MNFQGVRPDLVKFEMRQTSGRPAWMKEAKRPGFFGRLLSGLGRLVAGVAAPLSFIFPPAALAAAGMYGVGQIGDQIQYRAYQKAMENQSQLQNASFPGLDLGGSSFRPASSVSAQDQRVMDVLFSRDTASAAMVQEI